MAGANKLSTKQNIYSPATSMNLILILNLGRLRLKIDLIAVFVFSQLSLEGINE